MKFSNIFHQLDDEAIIIENQLKQDIYLFGTGNIGKFVFCIIKEFFKNVKFIDNNEQLHGKMLYERNIISINDYIDNHRDAIIVISVGEKNYSSIKKQLDELNMVEGTDYYYYEKFLNEVLPVYFAYCNEMVFLPSTQITVTERCTLRCKKCAHGCNLVKNDAKDMSLEDVKYTADKLFQYTDYVADFALIGGETLLYRELAEALEYIGSKYRNKIGYYNIVSNGTIVPDEKLLDVCKKYDINIKISNYSKALPKLIEKHKIIAEKAIQKGVKINISTGDSFWYDFGFDYVNRKCDENELIKVFDECKTICRESRYNRLYYCVMARCISENYGFHIGENDYLDLDKLDKENYIKQIMEFNLGYSEKGYLDMCARCNGKDAVKNKIPVAEQMKI